jgi:hypothetical protein
MKIHGYGDYVATVPKREKKEEDMSFSSAGGKVGKWLGTKLGHLIGQITGFGDYEVHGNSIMDGGMTPPMIVNSVENGAVVVRHREYIGDIASTINFNLTAYPINPGMSDTFPWLSQMAQSFEQYEMRGCIFEFVSTSSDSVLSSGTSTALGSVMLATEYDSLESNFSGKREMLNHEFANSTKPSCNIIHPIECKRDRTPVSQLYVRSDVVPSGGDKRLYDLGTFQLATEGMQATSGTLGELWISYEVAFYKQRYDPGLATAGLIDHFQLIGVTSSLPVGTGRLPVASSTLGGTIDSVTRKYTFPTDVSEGKYLFLYQVVGAGNGIIAAPALTLTNASFLNYSINDTLPGVYTPGALNTNTFFNTAHFQVTGPNATITWSTGTLPSGVVNGDLFIVQINPGLVSVTEEGSVERELVPEPKPAGWFQR